MQISSLGRSPIAEEDLGFQNQPPWQLQSSFIPNESAIALFHVQIQKKTITLVATILIHLPLHCVGYESKLKLKSNQIGFHQQKHLFFWPKDSF